MKLKMLFPKGGEGNQTKKTFHGGCTVLYIILWIFLNLRFLKLSMMLTI